MINGPPALCARAPRRPRVLQALPEAEARWTWGRASPRPLTLRLPVPLRRGSPTGPPTRRQATSSPPPQQQGEPSGERPARHTDHRGRDMSGLVSSSHSAESWTLSGDAPAAPGTWQHTNSCHLPWPPGQHLWDARAQGRAGGLLPKGRHVTKAGPLSLHPGAAVLGDCGVGALPAQPEAPQRAGPAAGLVP